MDILETLRRIGYSSPSQSWIQINKKIRIDDLAPFKKKQKTFYEPEDVVVILSRWMEHKRKGGDGVKDEGLFNKMAAEIASIKEAENDKKRKRDSGGGPETPSILPPHVQLNKEGYGFLVHWEVSAVFEKKNNRGLDLREQYPNLYPPLSFRVKRYDAAVEMSREISRRLQEEGLPEAIVHPTSRSSNLEEKMEDFRANLQKVDAIIPSLRASLEEIKREEGDAAFLVGSGGGGAKLFLLLVGCSLKSSLDTAREGVTERIYTKLIARFHEAGHACILLAGRHCGEKCEEYRRKPHHTGKCDRFSQEENAENLERFHAALTGHFEASYVLFATPGAAAKKIELEDKGFLVCDEGLSVVPVFMGHHASSCISSVQCMELQLAVSHGYCPHPSACNQESNCSEVASVFSALGVPVTPAEVKAWWLEANQANNTHAKCIATIVANSHANSVDSKYKVKLDERTPNGKDFYARCTACDKKMFHGNWTLHVKGKCHMEAVKALEGTSESSSQVHSSSGEV